MLFSPFFLLSLLLHSAAPFPHLHSSTGHIIVKESGSRSIMSDSLLPNGLYSPWNSPGQNTRVGSLSPSPGDLPNPGTEPRSPSLRQILYQLSHKGNPIILEWVAYPFSSRSSWSRNWTEVSCIAAGFFTRWATREAHTHNRACKHLLAWLNWGMLYWEGGPWVLLETERGLWMVTDCPFMSHLSWTLRRIWKAKAEWRHTLGGMSTAELMVSLTT